MPSWISEVMDKSSAFMPHGHCYLWIPSLLWLNVVSDALIGIAYLGISVILYLLVRRIRLPFSPVFIAFGLFIGLCGVTHFMKVWTVWNPDYLLDGLIKAATAAASVATAIGLLFVRPQVEEVVHAARLSEERRSHLEIANAQLESLYAKVTQLDDLKTRFFANASHELRTPLSLILGPVERILEDSTLAPAHRSQLESVSRNSRILLKRVNDILDIAKLEEGEMQPRYVRLNLASWFQLIASQFSSLAAQRRIDYRIESADAMEAEVDPEMLERVLVNLLSNAFKFTPEQGTVAVSLQARDGQLSLSVSDTGPGVAAIDQAVIFERFRQADSGAQSYGSTGLGLAIVKEFVELHHGQVRLESAPGHGATFIVTIPQSAPASAVVGEQPLRTPHASLVALHAALPGLTPQEINGQEINAQAINAQEISGQEINAQEINNVPLLLTQSPDKPFVLVVEDNPELSRFVASCLATDCNVVTAADGQEGLVRAQALRPDLIVTDIMMPRMRGDELVAAVRADSDLDSVPILLLSAKADDGLRIKLLNTGAQDYLVKPFLPQELRARAKNLIGTKRAGDALRKELDSASTDIETLAQALAGQHRQLQVALDLASVAREQAEKASLVKTYFLGLISHELRTPLSAISMNAEILAAQDPNEPIGSAAPRLARLMRGSKQMRTLVDGLLEYTRVASGKLEVNLESLDAQALASEVISEQADSVAPGARLVLSEPDPALPRLVSDGRLLRIILANLISNALKFTREGTVSLGVSATDAEHVFTVTDTGAGIPAEDIERIFLPFEQVEPVHRKSIPGVGLGLSLVKQTVEALSGSIEVRSEVGVGSRFIVRLPTQPVLDTSKNANMNMNMNKEANAL